MRRGAAEASPSPLQKGWGEGQFCATTKNMLQRLWPNKTGQLANLLSGNNRSNGLLSPALSSRGGEGEAAAAFAAPSPLPRLILKWGRGEGEGRLIMPAYTKTWMLLPSMNSPISACL